MSLPGQTIDIPEELSCVDADLLGELREGSILRLPESALNCVPDSLRDRIPDELIDVASANPALAATIGAVAAIATVAFLFVLVKRAFKIALLFALVAAAAWIWFVGLG